MIPITKPFLPPRHEYLKLIESAFERNWLTNNGPILQKVETEIQSCLNSCQGLVVSNGTIALQIAIKALGIRGKVLTTPFTYIATASSIAWEGCTPVFVDVEQNNFNVSASSIANALDDEIGGIVLTHCFGLPLDVKELDAMAAQRGVPIVYDASHAFGSTIDGESIMNFGDISTCSYHATKLFHMVEGGGIFSRHQDLIDKVSWLRNFGHNGPEQFSGIGINGKNSEIHAAMGLVNLRYLNEIMSTRKRQCLLYAELLSSTDAFTLVDPHLTGWNCAYYPILMRSERLTLRAMSSLNEAEIFPRRYFYPSLDSINDWKGHCPNSRDVASRVLCLPLYHDLTTQDQTRVASILIDCA